METADGDRQRKVIWKIPGWKVANLPKALAMIYHPDRGSMWDPSILWHDGRYYAFMMYNRDGIDGREARHCLLAVSEDGVHWHDEAVVIEERERGRDCKFCKCMVARCGE